MKQIHHAAPGGTRHSFAILQKRMILLSSIILLVFFMQACQKSGLTENDGAATSAITEDPEIIMSEQAKNCNNNGNALNYYNGLSNLTRWQLQQARAATAKYKKISKAIADGYTDISVVVPNMGHHYMKSGIVDATFDPSKPEILVYHKHDDGHHELVGVEYAVPISLSPSAAPAGFSGSGDVWDYNTGFGLWLLHAWVWKFNPDGVFNPTNPLVHQH